MKFPLQISPLLYREIHFHPSASGTPTQPRDPETKKKLENNFNIFFCALIKIFPLHAF